MELRIVRVDVGLAEEDPRNLAARAQLIEDLRTEEVEIEVHDAPSTGKGVEAIIVPIITSPIIIHAVVTGFGKWLDRAQHRTVTIQTGDQKMVIDAEKVKDGTFEKIVTKALEADSS